jgi:hypothetical protein
MDREEELKQYKKITLRFLKETGLYRAWFDYIKTPGGRDFIGNKKWYDKEFVISIFGATRFTGYLADKCGIILYDSIYKYFRTYVELYYPDAFDGKEYDERMRCKDLPLSQTELFSKFPQLKRE